jgi:hypothetical protein
MVERMSERSSWGPPRYETAPGRPRPLQPTSRLPDPSYATAHLPTTPIQAVRRQPAYQNEYRGGDEYGDDQYGDDGRGPDRADRHRYADDVDRYASQRPRRRGQLFAGLVVVLALVASALLYLLTYRMLASVDLSSADPFGGIGSQLLTIGGLVVGAVLVFVLALLALVIARPKALAALGLAVSLLLPVGAVVVGLVHGGSVLQQHVETSIAKVGTGAAAQGAAAADTVLRELERRGVELGPLRDLVVRVVGMGG